MPLRSAALVLLLGACGGAGPGGPVEPDPIRLVASPERLDFGMTLVGDAVQLGLTVSRTGGTGRSLGLAIEGSGDFSIEESSLPLRDGTAASITITFAPSRPGAREARLVVGDGLLAVPLAGEGLAVEIEAPEALAFPDLAPGTEAVLPLAIRSGSAVALEIASGVDPSPFSIDGGGAHVLPEGGELVLPVRFAPLAEGRFAATLALDVEGRRHEVALSGAAPPALRVEAEPAVADLDEGPVGKRHVREIRVHNLGSRTARLEQASLSTGTSAGFAVASPLPLPRSIPPGGVHRLYVQLARLEPGDLRGTLEIYVAGLAAPLEVALQGRSVDLPCEGACTAAVAGCPATLEARAGVGLDLVAAPFDSVGPLPCVVRTLVGPGEPEQEPLGPCAAALRFSEPGDYLVEVATEPPHPAASCQIPVRVEPAGGLWIETRWSVPTDVDLHLLHGSLDPLQPASWRDPSLAVRAGHPRGAWDAPGLEDDPRMLADEDVAAGLELLHLPAPPAHAAHAVGLHWAAALSPGFPVDVRTRVICDSVLVAEAAARLEDVGQAVLLGSVRRESDRCTFTEDGAELELPR